MKTHADTVRQALKYKRTKLKLTSDDFLSTGSTLLNLAISDRTDGGLFKGGYFYFVGDSVSGKTFLCMTCLAEAARREAFDNYDYVYDGTTENGALMDIRSFFGSKVEKRLIVQNSETVEDMYFSLDDRLNKGKPFIMIVDSMDGLDSEGDTSKFREQKKDFRKGREMKGSYGDGKAKTNSQNLRKMLTRLRKTGSILIVIGQTRDNIGAMGYGDKRTRAGGRSLKFYAQLEMWSSVAEKIRKKVNGKNRDIGIRSKIQIKKNRVNGKDRTVFVLIYHSFGIDDVGACIDYLIDEKYWKGTRERVSAPEFKFSGPKSKLIRKIEKNNLERELRAVVRKVWHRIEEQCTIKRKTRYE